MNARALAIVGRARGLLTLAPGSDSFQINESKSWCICTIRAVTDETVHQLAILFGLGEVRERRAARSLGGARWYLRAGAERTVKGKGTVRLDIVGPAHIEGPDDDLTGRAP